MAAASRLAAPGLGLVGLPDDFGGDAGPSARLGSGWRVAARGPRPLPGARTMGRTRLLGRRGSSVASPWEPAGELLRRRGWARGLRLALRVRLALRLALLLRLALRLCLRAPPLAVVVGRAGLTARRCWGESGACSDRWRVARFCCVWTNKPGSGAVSRCSLEAATWSAATTHLSTCSACFSSAGFHRAACCSKLMLQLRVGSL